MGHKPAGWDKKHGAAYQDVSVARAYQHRPPYPPEVFALLAGLITDTPRRILDIGCGNGRLARYLVPSVDAIDAIDASQAMIKHGQLLPYGDDPRLNWMIGRMEDALLHPSYALIIAGESLHFMEWEVVLPRLARLLSSNGLLVILDNRRLPAPWDTDLRGILQWYSLNQDYQNLDLAAELEQRGLFRLCGRHQTAPFPFTQSIDMYIESYHGLAAFSRERMTAAAATAFDADVHDLVSMYSRDPIELSLLTDIAWGKPLASSADTELPTHVEELAMSNNRIAM